MIPIRLWAIKAGLGLILFTVVCGLFLLGCGFVLYGTSLWLSQALGHGPWLAYLVTGGGLILLLLLPIWILLAKEKRKQKSAEKNQPSFDLQGILDRVTNSLDLEGRVQRHPWQSAGIAVAVGFAAGYSFSGDAMIEAGTQVFKKTLTPLLMEQVQHFLNAS